MQTLSRNLVGHDGGVFFSGVLVSQLGGYGLCEQPENSGFSEQEAD